MDFAIFTEEILNGKLHFLCSVTYFTGERDLVILTVGPTHQQDYRYTGQGQCVDIATFCRTIDSLFFTSTSIVLQNLGLTPHCS